MTVRHLLLSTLSALALSGCAAGPDYVAPIPPATSSGPFLSAADPAFTPTPVPAGWWRLYNDPVLDSLVQDALAANTDVRVALETRDARIAELEQQLAALQGVPAA